MTIKKLEDPGCSTPSGEHILEESTGPFYAQCAVCMERYLILSETVARDAGIIQVHSQEDYLKNQEGD